MQGELIVITPSGQHSRTAVRSPPGLDELQKIVEGSIEAIPYLNSIELDGKQTPCVAYCNEEGKLTGKELNRIATQHWLLCQHKNDIDINDVLVGTIVFIVGDEELMMAL